MLIIDVHAHIYSPDERRYQPKSKPLRVPGNKGSVDDLRAVMKANGVAAVRAIQTVSFYGYDNRYLCDAARANKGWLAGVATLDPDDPHSPGLLRQFVREYGVQSLRSVPSPARNSFDDPGVRALWKVVAEEGISVDIFLMRPEMVASAVKLLQEFPALAVGFCHCMDLKPGPALEPSLKTVCELARFKNLYAKVDFIGTGTRMSYPCSDLHAAALRVIDAYGPERCVWGSCFPNELWTPKITYAEHLRIFTEALPLKEAARRSVLGETARRLWFPHLKA
jgi:predicted TIM-barrel fold metal-dependent hydrolase